MKAVKVAIPRSTEQHVVAQQPRTLPLLLAACVIELCCLLINVLSPTWTLHLNDTPLTTTWTWLLIPAQWFAELAGASSLWLAPTLLTCIFASLLVIYAIAAHSTLTRIQAKAPQTSRLLLLLLGSTLLFGLTLLMQPKLFSDDVFTYIISGRLLAVYHVDPLNTSPIQFSSDPYVRWVIAGRYAPNIYGPLWYCIASVLTSLREAPVTTLLLFKGLELLSHLVNGLLIWCILRTVAPTRRLLGTLLYLWNPLILIELAGSGHNEGVLLTLLLTATWLYTFHFTQGGEKQQARSAMIFSTIRPWSHILAMLLIGVAVGMNLIVLLIVPLLAWFDVRNEQRFSRAFIAASMRVMLMILPALLLWLPFWRGASTFFALTSAIDMAHFFHSPLGLLVVPNRLFFKLLAYMLHFPWDPLPAADVTLRGSATFVFALLYSNLFSTLRRAPTTMAGMLYSDTADQSVIIPGIDTLFHTWGIALFTYIALITGWFWPWYLLWLLWVITLQRLDRFTSTMLVLSGTALLSYVFAADVFQSLSIIRYDPAIIFGIPLIYLLCIAPRLIKKHNV